MLADSGSMLVAAGPLKAMLAAAATSTFANFGPPRGDFEATQEPRWVKSASKAPNMVPK